MRYPPALVLLTASTAVSAALPSKMPPTPYIPGEIIVQYRGVGPVAAGTDSGGGSGIEKGAVVDPRERLRAMGLGSRRRLMGGSAELLALPSPMDVPGAIRTLSAESGVAYAEPNYRRYTLATPNDSLFGQLWGLRNTGQDNFACAPSDPGCPVSVPDADLNMLPAWDPANNGTFPRVGDASVVVAIIDEAFDTDHPDLAANFTAGRDLADDDSNPNPDSSSQEHGTLVAGSLGAVGNNNGIGVAGATWRSTLMPLKVGIAGQDGLSSAAIMQAIGYARDHGADIINASFGGPSFSQSEKNLICGLASDNILFVVSAGNDDANMDFGRIGYPALYDCPNIVTAAATNRQDNIASFSMYGPLTNDVAAPGLQVVTTAINGGYATGDTGGVAGTSFSAPYTSGIAALLRAHVPTTDEREIKARLIESGTSLGNADQRVAGGRIDAAAALDMTPRPSLTLDDVAIENDSRRLNPAAISDIRVTLANGWQNATSVTGTLHSDNPLVTVLNGGQGNFDSNFIPTGGKTEATFQAQVSSAAKGHNYVTFRLDLTADGGYATSRYFIEEIAPLAHDGMIVTQAFQPDSASDATLESGLYDEFHTWHVTVNPGDLPSPSGTNTLIVRTRTTNDTDIDLLGRAGLPPQYLITLNVDPNIPSARNFFCTSSVTPDCRDPNTRVSGRSDGHEAVTLVFNGSAAPENFYFTIVNFAQAAFDYEIWSELKAGDLRPGPGSICPGSEELCSPASAALTVSGLSTGAETFVYIQRGQYSINDGPFTGNDGSVGNGDIIHVAGSAANSPELTVGGITARFDAGGVIGPPPPGSGGGGGGGTTPPSSDSGGGGGGGCAWTDGGGKFDPLLHLLVLLAGLVLLRLPLSF